MYLLIKAQEKKIQVNFINLNLLYRCMLKPYLMEK